MKRYIYGIPLLLLVVYWVYIEWFILAAFLAGFLIGYVLAVDSMFKVATGRRMDNDDMTEVLDKLLP